MNKNQPPAPLGCLLILLGLFLMGLAFLPWALGYWLIS